MKVTEQQIKALDDFTIGYLEAAFWIGIFTPERDSEGLTGEETLEKEGWSIYDLSQSALAKLVEDCDAFKRDNASDLEEYYKQRSESDAGHDFFLTREGHGAGFWDRGLGELGHRLSEASKVYRGSTIDFFIHDGEVEFE